MSQLHSVYVPSEGSKKNTKIMIVGEAPGEQEHDSKRPFVGQAGQFLEQYLARAGVRRNEVFLTNLCKYRPKGNKFEYCLNTKELEQGLEELKQEIQEVNPNIIIACGNWPMYYLTGCISSANNAKPGSGITLWRGSIMPCSLVERKDDNKSESFYPGHDTLKNKYKVLITYHPAYVARPTGYEQHPIFLLDLIKAIKQSSFPEIKYPQYVELIDPSLDVLNNIVSEYCNSDWLSVDIETFGNKLACVGICNSDSRGVCFTTLNGAVNWEAVRAILASKAQKIFQYGAFDVNYLKWNYGWEVNGYARNGKGWDTYIAQNNLMPGFSKKLEFMASIYTDFPYYKEDRKSWKINMDLTKLWRYNIKDIIATYQIAMQQMGETNWRPL